MKDKKVILEVNDLLKEFKGGIKASNGISMTVDSGEVFGLLGPNGAGKTTTIRMLAGIIAPSSGYAVIAGQRTDGEIERLHEVIGLLTETPGFYENLGANRNLEFFAGFYSNLEAKSQVEKYLKLMGLWERRNNRVGTFSKGMKQKRTCAARPAIVSP